MTGPVVIEGSSPCSVPSGVFQVSREEVVVVPSVFRFGPEVFVTVWVHSEHGSRGPPAIASDGVPGSGRVFPRRLPGLSASRAGDATR